jgi:hypothetical protein
MHLFIKLESISDHKESNLSSNSYRFLDKKFDLMSLFLIIPHISSIGFRSGEFGG